MAIQTVATATLMCSMGMAPSTLMVLPKNRVMVDFKPAANIMDYIPMVNILPFNMCRSLANPMVAAATTAAMGVLTPAACIPVIPAPWAPGSSTDIIAMFPALNNTSKCMCTWGGTISITNPGTTSTMIP